MEHTKCLVCDADRPQVLCSGYDRLFGLPGEFTVVECSDCGFVYLNPRPSESEMKKYYPEEYYSFQRWTEEVGFLRAFYRRMKWKSLSRINLMRFSGVPPFVENGKILDVGCGSGEVLSIMKKVGWETYGVERDERAAKYARSKGLNVLNQDLRSIRFPDDYFDIVRMRSVLEHLHQVSLILAEVHRILKKQGRLFLIVPNIDSFEFKIFKSKWYPLDIPRHIYHFSPKSLTALLEKSRFKVGKIRYVGGGVFLLGSLDYLRHHRKGKHGTHLADKYFLRIPAFLLVEIWLNILKTGNLLEIRAHKV